MDVSSISQGIDYYCGPIVASFGEILDENDDVLEEVPDFMRLD